MVCQTVMWVLVYLVASPNHLHIRRKSWTKSPSGQYLSGESTWSWCWCVLWSSQSDQTHIKSNIPAEVGWCLVSLLTGEMRESPHRGWLWIFPDAGCEPWKYCYTDKIFFHVWANNNWVIVYVNNIHRGNVIISGEKYLHSCKKYFRAGMARAAVEARAACVSAAQWPVRPGEAPHSAAQCHHSAAAGTTTFLFWFLLSSTLHSRFSTWNSRKLIWTPWWRWVVTNCRVSTVFYLLSYNQSFVVTFSKHKHDYLSIFIHFIHYLSMYLCICFRLLHIAL